jgi:hypothetical protein
VTWLKYLINFKSPFGLVKKLLLMMLMMCCRCQTNIAMIAAVKIEK